MTVNSRVGKNRTDKTIKKYRRIPSPQGDGCEVVTMEESIGFVLGIDISDWRISESRQGVEDNVKVVHYTFEFCGNPGICPDCGMPRVVHDYKEKTWRNENLGDSVCYIHARVPRFQCRQCGKTSMVQVPWADPMVKYTRRFMESAIEHMAQMSILATARKMITSWSVLDGIVGRVVEKYLNEMDLSKVISIRIDETSAKKRHKYITVITDTETDDIIFISKGKDSEVLDEFRQWLLDHNGDPERIELASMDFGEAFAKGIRDSFPNAEIVRDPFHLIQIADKALDRDRSSSQVNGERKKSVRFALLKGEEKLTPEERDIVMDFTRDHEDVGLSYRMKESLRDAISYSSEESQLAFFHLRTLASWFQESGTKGFKALGKTIEKNIGAIVKAVESGVNNGFQEGLNGRIQLTKSLARGYHREARLARMVFFRDINRSM